MSKIIFQRNSDKIKTKNNIASIELRLNGLSFSIVTTGGKCLLIKEFSFIDELSPAENIERILSQEPLLTSKCDYKQINVVLTTWSSTMVPAKVFDIRYAENYITNIGIEPLPSDTYVVSPLFNETISVVNIDKNIAELLKNIANQTPLKFFHILQENIAHWHNKPVKSRSAVIAYFAPDSVSISVFADRKMVYADTLRTNLHQEQTYYVREILARYPSIKSCYVYGQTDGIVSIEENNWNILAFTTEVYTEFL